VIIHSKLNTYCTAHEDETGPSWFFLQPDLDGDLKEQRLLDLGYDYRGR
jgi:hypothetical protein